MALSTILIVEARFYPEIADELAQGCENALRAAGAAFERVSVPGAFEIPAAVRFAIGAVPSGDDSGRGYDGFVALGCVIRGETSHYDYVCSESARGLQDLALEFSLAIGYGILTVENREQAWVRAATDQGDKGGDAARACLRMVELKSQLGPTRRK